METEREERTCLQKTSHELSEAFCKPKARCFKGLAILSAIYTLGCGLMLMVIPPVVKAHGFAAGSKVEDHLDEMKTSTLVLLVIMAGLAIVFSLSWKVYEKRESRREAIISGNLIPADNDFGASPNEDEEEFYDR